MVFASSLRSAFEVPNDLQPGGRDHELGQRLANGYRVAASPIGGLLGAAQWCKVHETLDASPTASFGSIVPEKTSIPCNVQGRNSAISIFSIFTFSALRILKLFCIRKITITHQFPRHRPRSQGCHVSGSTGPAPAARRQRP
jgi:hypothetical protein